MMVVDYCLRFGQRTELMTEEDPRKLRLVALREQHRKLDDDISALVASRAFDQLEVQRLKKKKLRLKDEIARLESAVVPDIIA